MASETPDPLPRLMESLRTRDKNSVEFREAFWQLYQVERDTVRGAIVSRLWDVRVRAKRQLVEDAEQDTWMKFLKSVHKYDETKGTVAGWLTTMAQHSAYDILRKALSIQEKQPGEAEGEFGIYHIGVFDAQTVEAADSGTLEERISHACKGRGNAGRAARLYYVDKMPVQMIAQQIGRKPKTIYDYLDQAREFLDPEIMREWKKEKGKRRHFRQ